jgi:ABC-type glycerol-3-phosphate transport system substrate-binding protein
VFYASSCPTYPLAYRYYYEDIRDYISGTLTVIPYPTLSGARKYHTIPNDCIAVNSKCKNKDIAFKYVKIAVSYEMQRDRDSRGKPNSVYSTPINDKAVKDDVLSYPVAKALPELTEKMLDARGFFEPCLVREYNIRQMTNAVADEYREGTKTLEQAAKEMDDKVNVYLNE